MAIAFDLDGTLARYDGWKSIEHIGEPITMMVNVLKRHIAQGDECIIHTARVSGDAEEANLARHYIAKWLRTHNLPDMEITCIKLKKFRLFYDDRAIAVTTNLGPAL